MESVRVNSQNPQQEVLEKIVSILKAGEIVVLPTETVYTFAVDATNPKAVERAYKLKGRKFTKPMHVVVASIKEAENYVEVSDAAKILAQHFLPGPLTLVLQKKSSKLPGILTAGIPTLGIRIPDLPLNLLIAQKFGKPYTTTSANISGRENPYSVEEILNQLSDEKKGEISLIVDAGKLPNLPPSTLLDLTQSPPTILRPGPVSKEQIEQVLNINLAF